MNKEAENVIKEPENGTNGAENVEKAPENVSAQAEIIPPAQNPDQSEAVNVFAPAAKPAAPAQEKKYRATFWVEGNLEQIKALREYMIQNGIKFGKAAK